MTPVTQTVTTLVRISGRVQGVGYRAWCKSQARTRGLSGWVRNRKDGSVEACFCGPAEDVDQMVRACHDGPLSAAVLLVDAKSLDTPVEGDFIKKETI